MDTEQIRSAVQGLPSFQRYVDWVWYYLTGLKRLIKFYAAKPCISARLISVALQPFRVPQIIMTNGNFCPIESSNENRSNGAKKLANKERAESGQSHKKAKRKRKRKTIFYPIIKSDFPNYFSMQIFIQFWWHRISSGFPILRRNGVALIYFLFRWKKQNGGGRENRAIFWISNGWKINLLLLCLMAKMKPLGLG